MKIFFSVLILMVIFWSTVFLPIHQSKAEVSEGGFTLDGIDVRATIKDDASFVVTETITGDFQEERHGLFRSLPRFYKEYWLLHKIVPVKVLKVTKNGQDEPFETYSEGAYLVIKIGDPEKVFSGPFVYVIEYEVERALLYQEDSLVNWYWNVATDEWGTPVGKITSKITLPSEKEVVAECWGGIYSFDRANCEVTVEGNQVFSTSEDWLTLAVRFKPGADFYWPTQIDNLKYFLIDNWDLGFFLLPIILFFVLFIIWKRIGHDPHGRGTIVAEYDPPDDLSAAEISALVFSTVSKESLTAIIIDLAVRGFLRIEETEKSKIWLKGNGYKLIKIKEPDASLRDFEKEFLEKIFGNSSEKLLSDCNEKFLKTKRTIDKMIWKKMVANDYFPHDPETVRSWFFGLGGGMVALNIIIGFPMIEISDRYSLVISLFIMAIIFFVFAPFMSRRSQKGTYAAEKAKGFRLFLNTAEKYRLQWQEREGIFEKFLPYAIIFGVANKWAQNFSGLLQESPGWYHGTTTGFVGFSSGLNSFITTTNSLAAPSSSSSGGSSGGGFGGGGGGSW